WPENQEAACESAVRAALAVVAAMAEKPIKGETLQVRVGVATGVVVVGDSIGFGDARQQTAIGETPNLAARLQGIAGPNGAVIDAATRRQIGNLFACRDLGEVALKGFGTPQRVWRVEGGRAFEDRFAALRPARRAPLVDRDRELTTLLDC